MLVTKYKLSDHGANLPKKLIENWMANRGINPLKIAGWSVEENSTKNAFFGLGCISLAVLFLFNMVVFSPDFRGYSVAHTWVCVVLTILSMFTGGLFLSALIMVRLPKELKTQLDEFVGAVTTLQSHLDHDFFGENGEIEDTDLDRRISKFLTRHARDVLIAERNAKASSSWLLDGIEEAARTKFKQAYWFLHDNALVVDAQLSFFDRAREDLVVDKQLLTGSNPEACG